jgi:molybdopterin molybdotransferase
MLDHNHSGAIMTKLDIYGFDQALEMALDAIRPTSKRETIATDQALGRVIAHGIVCQKNMPSFDNSAMDGFGVRSEDAKKKLEVVDTVFAGDIPQTKIYPGQAVRIMTGAQIPQGVDTIVPIEDCPEVTESYVVLPEKLKKGNNLRLKGEEQTKGAVLLDAGTKLEPSHIAMLSAQGIVEIEAYARLSIAVVSTGDEIREPWEESSEDEIYNANAFGITALLSSYGFSSKYVGSIPDNLEATKSFISNLKEYDVIISTGGISMGDADYLFEAYVANGMKPIFHGVNVKPGRPAMMGVMGETFVMAMPGNPLTAMVNIFLLSMPVLFKKQGASNCHHQFVYADNTQQFKARSGRTNLVLGRLENGHFQVTRNNKYGSGMLTPLMESNAIVVLGESRNGTGERERLKVIPFSHPVMAASNEATNE